MAKEKAQEKAPEKKTTQPVAQQEPEYSATEIAANSRTLFGYHQDLASAALAFNKVQSCTLDRAKKLIKEFAERKVK